MSSTKLKQEDKQKTSPQETIKDYFKGVKAEWSKISWPQKDQIVAETVIVLIVVFVFTLIVFLMDIVFKGILGLIK